jgi:hypothetical protein
MEVLDLLLCNTVMMSKFALEYRNDVSSLQDRRAMLFTLGNDLFPFSDLKSFDLTSNLSTREVDFTKTLLEGLLRYYIPWEI